MRRAFVACLAVGATVGVAPVAARDSHAPVGASNHWLPCQAWVEYHWLPYSERRLLHVLRVTRPELLAWLRDDDHHSVRQLAARRGLTVAAAADRLVSPWRGQVSRARYAALGRRARDTLTQPHLAQHVLFHYFHEPAIAIAADRIFGVSPLEYQRALLLGRSPAEIARAHGRSPAQAAREALRVLRIAGARGVAQQATSASQAKAFYSMQRRGVRHWLYRHISKPGFHGSRAISGLHGRRLVCFLMRGHAADPPRHSPHAG